MDQEEAQRTARDLRQVADKEPAADSSGPPEDGEAAEEEADYSGLPRSVFGRAMLALLAVFWIVAVIMLFTQGGR
jgi:uncharacterized membrane protein YcjF (UPF0283 family)